MTSSGQKLNQLIGTGKLEIPEGCTLFKELYEKISQETEYSVKNLVTEFVKNLNKNKKDKLRTETRNAIRSFSNIPILVKEKIILIIDSLITHEILEQQDKADVEIIYTAGEKVFDKTSGKSIQIST